MKNTCPYTVYIKSVGCTSLLRFLMVFLFKGTVIRILDCDRYVNYNKHI